MTQTANQYRTITFISKGNNAPSTRYRARLYEELLMRHGWKSEYVRAAGSVSNKIAALNAIARSDVTVVIRKSFSWLYFLLIRRLSSKLIFDFDDAIFRRDDGNISPSRQRRFANIVRHADLIWAGNDYLASEARKINSSVFVVPTSVNLDKYNIVVDKPKDTFDLVWIGSTSTKRYIDALIPLLERAAIEIKNLRLKIVSDFSLHSDTLKIINIPWCSDNEMQSLASAHVGIAPMVDNPWTKGKCGLKVLQYMAAGLPVISSNVGANAQIISHGDDGFLASDDDDWLIYIRRLSENLQLGIDMGTKGKINVANNYSDQSSAKILLHSLDSLFPASQNSKS